MALAELIKQQMFFMIAMMQHICVQHTVCACIVLLCSSGKLKAIPGFEACKVRFTCKLSHLRQSSQSIPTKAMASVLAVACSELLWPCLGIWKDTVSSLLLLNGITLTGSVVAAILQRLIGLLLTGMQVSGWICKLVIDYKQCKRTSLLTQTAVYCQHEGTIRNPHLNASNPDSFGGLYLAWKARPAGS